MQPKVGHPRGRPAIGGPIALGLRRDCFRVGHPTQHKSADFSPSVASFSDTYHNMWWSTSRSERTWSKRAPSALRHDLVQVRFRSKLRIDGPPAAALSANCSAKVHGPWPMRRRCGRKPNSVPLRVTIISLRLPLPDSSEHATRPILRTTGALRRGLLALARDGVCPASSVTRGAVRSYRTVSPLPPCGGGLFSVALSLTPAPGPVVVSHHRVLPCSDFPPVGFPTSDRLTMCKD